MAGLVWNTHTGLILEWRVSAGEHVVWLHGSRSKVLYEGRDAAMAETVYGETKTHYEAVAKDDPREPAIVLAIRNSAEKVMREAKMPSEVAVGEPE